MTTLLPPLSAQWWVVLAVLSMVEVVMLVIAISDAHEAVVGRAWIRVAAFALAVLAGFGLVVSIAERMALMVTP